MSRSEWSPEECQRVRAAMHRPPNRPPAARTLTGLIATDGGVAGGTRPTTALGSWAWCNNETGQEAAGYVERRPGQGVSTARAEVTAVAKVAPFAAKGAILLIDNQAVANRVKAMLAWARGGRAEATQLVQLAESAESQAEAEESQDPLEQAASSAHLRAAIPALAIHAGTPVGEGAAEPLERRLLPARDAELWAEVANFTAWTGGSANA